MPDLRESFSAFLVKTGRLAEIYKWPLLLVLGGLFAVVWDKYICKFPFGAQLSEELSSVKFFVELWAEVVVVFLILRFMESQSFKVARRRQLLREYVFALREIMKVAKDIKEEFRPDRDGLSPELLLFLSSQFGEIFDFSEMIEREGDIRISVYLERESGIDVHSIKESALEFKETILRFARDQGVEDKEAMISLAYDLDGLLRPVVLNSFRRRLA
ncbi:hypothetical protein ACES2I_08765 [Bdellovibrio bacteriovorus]|uniref:hypothetical protein n=1 Tax=Bdellovibrio bacteriovorus TaxID=959 RepID=UPI0035A6CFAE